MAIAAATVPDSPHRSIFHEYIIKSTRMSLIGIRQATGPLPDDEVEQAMHTLSYAFKLPQGWSETRRLLLTMAPKMEQAGYRDEWIPYLTAGIHQSRRFDDLETTAELHLQLGILYRLRGKYEPARIELEASVRQFEALDDPFNQARALNRLAQVARLERQFEESVRLAETALSLLAEQEAERGYSYLVLGMVAVDTRQWPEGVDYLKRSLNLWERADNQRMMGRCFMSLGSVFLSMKQYQASLRACRKAIDMFKEADDPVYRAIAQMNLGNVYYWLEQPDEALKLHLQAKRIFRRAQDQFYLAHVNHNIGMAHRKLQQWEKAEEAYLLAIERYRQLGNVAWMVDSFDGLGLTYLEQGQPEKAKRTFEEALNRLAQIEGEPSYENHFKMVSTHLREALEDIAKLQKESAKI